MASIRLEFAQFGHFDSFDIIRSMTSMAGVADMDLPPPIATGIKTMYYADTDIVEETTYYYKVRVWRGATSFVSSEVKILANIYWEKFSSLLHFNGANNSTVFTDEKGTLWSRVGSPYISAAQSKFGGASGRFSKNNYIQSTDISAYTFSAIEDFTVEAWVYIPTGATVIGGGIPIICVGAQDVSSSGGGWNLLLIDEANASIRLERDNTNGTTQEVRFNIGSAIPRDTWMHIECGRKNGVTHGFYQGELIGTSAVHNNIPFNSPNIRRVSIGSGDGVNQSNIYCLDGFIDELAVTKGVCNHTKSFTPKTTPFTSG
ncbi:LamG-like jellyroll fold domain-containing protein [Acinetobacter sp. YH12235]|uniref:LamG-like jellyroll fold domain-containing protein n=1 Tax=Acinetobacter sp. YH12235 TaxID=2601162 RepID=UPI0015D2C29F|nr:LamG-like jellyroll fold domain-containing protein [Acinetobacter sp. YH12235]